VSTHVAISQLRCYCYWKVSEEASIYGREQVRMLVYY